MKAHEKKKEMAKKVKVRDDSSDKDQYRFKMSETMKRGVKRFGGQHA